MVKTYVAMIFFDSTSQMRTFESSPDEARYFPLGEKASSRMPWKKGHDRGRRPKRIWNQLLIFWGLNQLRLN